MTKYNGVLQFLGESEQSADASAEKPKVITTIAAVSQDKFFDQFEIVTDLVLDERGYIDDDRYEGEYHIILIDDIDDYISNLEKIKKAFEKYE